MGFQDLFMAGRAGGIQLFHGDTGAKGSHLCCLCQRCAAGQHNAQACKEGVSCSAKIQRRLNRAGRHMGANALFPKHAAQTTQGDDAGFIVVCPQLLAQLSRIGTALHRKAAQSASLYFVGLADHMVVKAAAIPAVHDNGKALLPQGANGFPNPGGDAAKLHLVTDAEHIHLSSDGQQVFQQGLLCLLRKRLVVFKIYRFNRI